MRPEGNLRALFLWRYLMDDVSDFDISDGDTPPSAEDIVDAARNQLDSNAYQLYNYNDGIPSGEPKDHQFVANVLNNAGLTNFDGDISKQPSISDWANPNSDIPGWTNVEGPPQAGDILATDKPIPSHWYVSPGQSIGIATGDGTSIGIRDNNRIAESDFGLQEGHDPTIWRSTQLASSNTPQNQTDDQPQNKTPQQQQEDDEIDKIGGKIGGYIGKTVCSEFGPTASKICEKAGTYVGQHFREYGNTDSNFYKDIPPGML